MRFSWNLSSWCPMRPHMKPLIYWKSTTVKSKMADSRSSAKVTSVFAPSTSHHPFPHFAPKIPILGRCPQNPCTNPISALNVRESPKFSRSWGNRGRGTRWWRQILDRKYITASRMGNEKMHYSPYLMAESPKFLKEQFGHCGIGYGQIPRSTERISSCMLMCALGVHRQNGGCGV